MTDEIEGRAEEYLRKIDEMGGMRPAISKGYVQREIQDAACSWQRQVEAKQKVVVGVNAYRSDDPPVTVMRVDPALEERQVAAAGVPPRAERHGGEQRSRRCARGEGDREPDAAAPRGREGGGDARRDLRRARGVRRVPGDGGTLTGR